MGKLKIGLLFLFGIIAAASCEKDDICVNADVPLLVIEFYNNEDTSALKKVTALRVLGEGQSITVGTETTDRSNLDKFSIPLKTNEDITQFLFISNSASAEDGKETGNIDTINFSYKRIEDFESRACGFIVNYDSLKANLNLGKDNWIQKIEIVRSQVINSDSTHVKIFH